MVLRSTAKGHIHPRLSLSTTGVGGACRRAWRASLVALATLLLLLVSADRATAQAESGASAIEGTVLDPHGGAVPGVTVTIRNVDTGYQRLLVTDAAGRYLAQVMPVGAYDVAAELSGFAPDHRARVQLRTGHTERVDLRLALAAIQVQVLVVGDPPGIDTQGTATAESLNERAVADLPVRGRNFTEFVQLTPAIVQESDRSGLIIAGQRSINSNVALDGADFNDPLQGNQRGGNQAVFFFPQSAVREFQVIRSGATAEVGRTNAGFVNVVTKSGTNSLRGETFYVNRNRHLTSPDAFDRSLDNGQNQFGGAIGGPIRRDRAFFFFAAEQNFLRVPFVVEFDRQAPRVVVPAQLQALEGEHFGTNNPTALFFRTDVMLNPQHSLNLHGTYTRFRGENFNFDSPQQSEAAENNYRSTAESVGVKAGVVSTLGPRTVNEFRAQVATDDRREQPNAARPEIEIRGFGTIGGNSGYPRLFDSTRYQLMNNLSWAGQTHRVRVGFDFNMNRLRQQRAGNIQGRYDFRSLDDYLVGRINRYRQTVVAFDEGEMVFTGTMHELALFVQDRIALSPNVTLAAGLRWEGQWNPDPDRANPDISETASIPNDLAMWQPRLGLAWNVAGTGRTLVRLSSGTYTARTPANLFQRVFTENGVTTRAVDSRFDPQVLRFLSFPNGLSSFPPGISVPAPRVFGFDPNFRNPRSYQVSATVEQQVSDSTMVAASWILGWTRFLHRRLDRNLFPPSIDATGMPIFPRQRPNPAIGRLSINESTARSNYDALTLTATRRMMRYLQMQANYTLAWNDSDDDNERNFSLETTQNPFDLSPEWGPSKQDVRHKLNLNTVAELPGGVVLSAIMITRSGFPYTAIIGTDTQNDGNDDNDRAIIDGRVVGRNSFRQPAFFNLDLRLAKTLRLDHGRQLTLIAEVYNATRAGNRHFGNDSVSEYGTPDRPIATAGEPLFAPSTARFGGPRQLQLGLRVSF